MKKKITEFVNKIKEIFCKHECHRVFYVDNHRRVQDLRYECSKCGKVAWKDFSYK